MFTVIRTELDVYAPEVPDKMFHDINKIYKARRVAGRSGSSAAVQRNLDSLKKEADGNIINFHNGTCKILQVVGINPRHWCVQVQRVEGGYPPSALVRQVLGPVVGSPQQRRKCRCLLPLVFGIAAAEGSCHHARKE